MKSSSFPDTIQLMTAKDVLKVLRGKANKKEAEFAQRFFKTGKREYGEGDIFLGIRVPELRRIAKTHKTLPLSEIEKLLQSKLHEARFTALVLLIHTYKAGQEKEVYKCYRRNHAYINNWDLVDISASHIVGAYLFENGGWRKELIPLAKSKNLWDRRIAIISTLYFISQEDFKPTITIATLLINDTHDLIHKAVGWMLREVGKRDQAVEEAFLKKHYKKMPRTMLRYAIERFPEKKRKAYLKGTI